MNITLHNEPGYVPAAGQTYYSPPPPDKRVAAADRRASSRTSVSTTRCICYSKYTITFASILCVVLASLKIKQPDRHWVLPCITRRTSEIDWCVTYRRHKGALFPAAASLCPSPGSPSPRFACPVASLDQNATPIVDLAFWCLETSGREDVHGNGTCQLLSLPF